MQAVLISVVPEHGKRRHFGKLPFQRTFNYGLLSVASVAVQNGYDVDVWDTADPAFSDDGALSDALHSAAPSVVGLSCISGFSYPRMLRLSSTIRRALPNSTIVVGGMDHVGRIPLLVLDEAPEIDAVVSGYGEMPFLAVLNAKRSNSRSISAPGVTTRDHSEVAIDLDKLAPLPNLDYRRYLGLRSLPASVELARGCPFSCAFCISAGGSLKRRTPTDLAEQMLQACIAYDDARLRLYLEAPIATFGKDYLKSLRAELSARGISPTWRAESRVDVLRPELVDELAESGCRVLDLGLESASPKVLAWMQKTFNPPDYLRRSAELLGALAQAEIFSKVNVLFYAGETMETVTETRDFLFERKSEIGAIAAGPLYLYPGIGGEARIRMLLEEQGGGTIESDEWKSRHLIPVNPSRELGFEQLSELALEWEREFQSAHDYWYNRQWGYFSPGTSYAEFVTAVHQIGTVHFPFPAESLMDAAVRPERV
jgi:anaerobic magnesium-protoporphyrin IX monomethyl ester cyclase